MELVISAPDLERPSWTDRARSTASFCGATTSFSNWHLNAFRVAYWDLFGRPETRPAYGLGFDTWWMDDAKSKQVRDWREKRAAGQ